MAFHHIFVHILARFWLFSATFRKEQVIIRFDFDGDIWDVVIVYLIILY